MKIKTKKKLLQLGTIIYLPEHHAITMIVAKRGGSHTVMNSFHKDTGCIIPSNISTKKFSIATKKQKELYFQYLFEHATNYEDYLQHKISPAD